MTEESRAVSGMVQEPLSIDPDANACGRVAIPGTKSRRWPLVVLFVGFYSLYVCFGIFLSKTSAFSEWDLLFQMDTYRVIDEMVRFDGNHLRTKVHPIYVILMNPIGSAVSLLTRSDVLAAILINSFLGALGVLLALFFFRSLTGSFEDSLILSAFYGFSMSHLIVGAVPETYSLAAVGLILSYSLFLQGLQTKQVRLLPWVLVGILSLGVLTTNIVQTFICFTLLAAFVAKERTGRLTDAYRHVFAFLALVVFSTVSLALMQKAIYPSAKLFFVPSTFAEEMAFVSNVILREPLKVLTQVFKHVFFVNFIGVYPDEFAMPARLNPAITFSTSWHLPLFGLAGTALLLILLVKGSLNSLRSGYERRLFSAGIVLCLLFNVVLHSLYGVGQNGVIELFLYTPNFTFLVLIFIGGVCYKSTSFIRLSLILLLILTGLNNLMIMREILAIYS